MISRADSNIRLHTEPSPLPSPRLRIDTQLGDSADGGPSNKRWKSMGDSEACASFLSPTRPRCNSPIAYVKCDGWCKSDPFARRVAVSMLSFSCRVDKLTIRVPQLSLSACSDPQRAWEGPRGSLTTVLCKYLGKHIMLPTFQCKFDLICTLFPPTAKNPRTSYRNLMTYVKCAINPS